MPRARQIHPPRSSGGPFAFPFGVGGTLPNFADAEVPSGTINGANTAFTLLRAPNPSTSLELFLNGVLQTQGVDYTLSTNTINFTTAPASGGALIAWYRY
jgi:hypothetical protein